MTSRSVYRKAYLTLVVLFLVTLVNLKTFCDAAPDYRLNKNVLPESYDIKLTPYLSKEDGVKEFTFDGVVDITLSATRSNVQLITLHKDYIEIEETTLLNTATGEVIQNVNTNDLSSEKETDKLSVSLQQPLALNTPYTLRFRYTGQIRNGMAGVFRANYTDVNGNAKLIALTQAQRIDARTITPCFDEPAFKAKFRMRISRPKEYNAVFNTRLVNSEVDRDNPNRYLDTFDWTPKMSTYLLAFMISEYVKRGDDDLVILSRPEFYEYTSFTYEVAKRTVEAYNDYTKRPYKDLGNSIMQKASSPKFPHNGMENWGLVLYSDPVLVQEPGYNDGWKDKQYTITILVHETAHMWFGNSVTFAWWSYFWLNEAFARYYQFYLAHELYPEYQLDQQFITNQLQMIFAIDAVNTTQPMTTPEELVETPSQIASKFSSIAYAKGASIVRMFRNLMGHANFDLAIQNYLKEFHLQGTVPSDLFKHLKQNWPKEQKIDLDAFFHDWTEQVGFPVLYVQLSENRLEVSLEQQRFLLSPNDGSDPNLKYTIPITFTTDVERNFEDLTPKSFFAATSSSIQLKFEKPLDWIIFNIQQSNYHRVFYDSKILAHIKTALDQPQHSGIHVINRAQLIDDLFNFARVGLIDYVQVFEFIEYLAKETDYLPWTAAFNGLQRVAQRLTLDQQKDFGKFILDITAEVSNKLGVESNNDTVLDISNRNNVVQWTCKYKQEDCNKKVRDILSKANSSNTRPSPDFRETVYCNAIRHGDFTYYRIVDDWKNVETRDSEKQLLYRALGCTAHLAEFHFARILTGEVPREYQRLTLKPLYADNPENVSPVFTMITQTAEGLAEQLGGWPILAEVVSDVADYFTTKQQQQDLELFIHNFGPTFGNSLSVLQNAVKKVENNLQWAESHLNGLRSYLKARNSAALNCASLLLLIVCGISIIF